MKINFGTILKTLDDEAIQVPSEGQSSCQLCGHIEEPKDLTLAKVAITALLNAKQDEGGEKKLDRYILAQRIKQFPVVELSSEDIVFVRKEISVAYGPLVYGRSSELLDPGEIKKLSQAHKVPEEPSGD